MRVTRPEEIYEVLTPIERGLLAIKGVKGLVQQYEAEHNDESLHDDSKYDPYAFVDDVHSILETYLPEAVFAQMVEQGKLEDAEARMKPRLHSYAHHTELPE